MSVSILIADDHGVLRAGLRALLNAEEDLRVVGEAGSGQALLQLVARLHPDIVLLDLNLPDMSGLEVLRRLSREALHSRVVILTMYDDQALLREAIEAGAAGYVVKRAVESELINAIRAAAAGELYVHSSLVRGLLRDEVPPPDAQIPGGVLTPREIDVLRLLAQGYTNRQIAERLHLSRRTVESHRANLKAKLALDSRDELVRYAVEHRLLTDDHADGAF